MVFLYDKNGIRQNSEETEIGVILPLTGDWGGFGHRMENGILLWKKQNPNARVNIHIEDGMGKANNSISAFNKLISVNMINACITGVSPVVLGLAPVAEKKKFFLSMQELQIRILRSPVIMCSL
ncbi:ABC transporter substrate-binding protein [Akkermansia massiliensis]